MTATDWPRKGFDLMSGGTNTVDGAIGNLTLDVIGTHGGKPVYKFAQMGVAWTYPTPSGSPIRGGVVLVGGYLYFLSTDGYFYKVNATNGALVLRVQLHAAWSDPAHGDAPGSTPHVIGGVAYVGGYDGFLYMVDVSTMTVLRRSVAMSDFPVRCDPVVSGGLVFWVATRSGIVVLEATDITNGATGWEHNTGGFGVIGGVASGIAGALSIYDGKVHAPGVMGVSVYDVGGTFETLFVASNVVQTGVAMATDSNGVTHCIFGGDAQTYQDYDADSGARIWENHQAGDLAAPACIDVRATVNGDIPRLGLVALGTRNFSIQPHELQTGEIRWKRDGTASAKIVAGLSSVNGILIGVWPPDDGRLGWWHFDDPAGGQVPQAHFGTHTLMGRWDNDLPGGEPDPANKGWFSTPIAANGVTYWAADNGKVYAFS